MSDIISRALLVLMLLAGLALIAFGRAPDTFNLPDPHGPPGNQDGPPATGRTIVTFWEKWTRHEAAAMQRVVDKYNLTDGTRANVYINMVSMSNINQKMLIATAGGDPPDICGLWSAQIGPYIANAAIEPLDELEQDGTITPATYKPFVWRVCAPNGRLYAASSTANTCALYWNKDLFRKAGLDPETPPRSIAQLDAFARQLTLKDAQGRYTQFGFLPNEPGWWDYYWGIYWGNHLWDKDTGYFHIDTPAQRAAYTWYQSYPVNYGISSVQSFQSGFGQFNSPQNAFINGQVAMEVQGPFFAKFIELNNPSMVGHYGVSFVPLPDELGLPPNSIALGDLDTWVIPRGAKHRKEALDVLRFFTRQDNMEALCIGHAKPSPLATVSKHFFRDNPNPYIDVFEKTMWAPDVEILPQSPVWERVELGDINIAIGNMWREPARYPVGPTLAEVQKTADRIVNDYKHYATMRQAWEHRTGSTAGATPASAPAPMEPAHAR